MKSIEVVVACCFAILVVTAMSSRSNAANPTQAHSASNIVSIYAPRESRVSMASMREPASNLDFNYPKSWQRQADSDKDTVLKLAGTSDGHYGEFKISKVSDVTDIQMAKNFMESGLAKAFPGSSKLSEREVRFGTKYQFTGTDLEQNLNIGEAIFRDRMVFVSDNGHLLIFSFLCKNSDYALMSPLFDQILASMHHEQGASAVTPTATKKALTFEKYSDKSGQISFNYPTGWKFENRDPGKDLDIKFSGVNAQGLNGELSVARIDRSPTLSLEQFIDTYEDTYMKGLKDLRRQATHRTTFGINHTEGHIHYSTFTVDGHPMRQAAAFFADSGHYYCVALNSALWPERDSRDMFEQVLASLKFPN